MVNWHAQTEKSILCTFKMSSHKLKHLHTWASILNHEYLMIVEIGNSSQSYEKRDKYPDKN